VSVMRLSSRISAAKQLTAWPPRRRAVAASAPQAAPAPRPATRGAGRRPHPVRSSWAATRTGARCARGARVPAS
jgi:hypothetical protein